jgi:FeS assembly SUF system regulator
MGILRDARRGRRAGAGNDGRAAHCTGMFDTVLFQSCIDPGRPSVLRVSKLTDYATVVMACLATRGMDVASAQTLAESSRLEAPTVSKLLKQLAQAGLVVSTRGVNGGYRLAREPENITIADIVVAMEGPIGMTECSATSGSCGHEPHCGVRVNWRRINQAIAGALASVSLADMTRPPARRSLATPLRVASA